ncbi:hypothetical protein FH972_008380 [Carpinus fangiana]|uniref:BHLH domain-containing protein n=1 Tax=Carpinus fangiana TaxID=176857 RepID=A0A5N6R0V2_9ROSI|nr:hypothetical protein FH972_008380 [Carpinus fangiana]
MMGMFYPYDLPGDIFWHEAYVAPPVSQSAFAAYAEKPRIEFGSGSSGGDDGRNCVNVNKRMIDFLRRSWHPRTETEEPEKERCFRHMMNERLRRERQKQSYMALHSMLPFGTKSDKNSIIQMAAKNIEEMQRRREELQRRKLEVEANLAAAAEGGAKIRVRVANPASGVDSMVEVLKCLKSLGLKTTTIRSNFSAHEFSAELQIDTQIGVADVEKAIQKSLYEVERKLLRHFEEGWKS